VIWGGIHGAWLSLERLFTREGTEIRPYNRILGLIVVGLSWVFFRSKSLTEAFRMLGSLSHFEWQRQYGPEILFLGIVSALILAVDLRLEAFGEEYIFQRSNLIAPVCTAAVMAVIMVILAASETNAFIYFQF
jgi:hypothetical protein